MIPRMIKQLAILTVLGAGLLLAGCGDDEPTTPDPATSQAPAGDNDPYERYLDLAPEQPADWTAEWPLSPDDAQTRALGGCGQEWAPGTVDAALADAYGHLCP